MQPQSLPSARPPSYLQHTPFTPAAPALIPAVRSPHACSARPRPRLPCTCAQVQLENLTSSFQSVTEDLKKRFAVNGEPLIDESVVGSFQVRRAAPAGWARLGLHASVCARCAAGAAWLGFCVGAGSLFSADVRFVRGQHVWWEKPAQKPACLPSPPRPQSRGSSPASGLTPRGGSSHILASLTTNRTMGFSLPAKSGGVSMSTSGEHCGAGGRESLR